MSEELASLESTGESPERLRLFNKAVKSDSGVLFKSVEGVLPAADDVILEKDGVFVISEKAHADGLPCDEGFKALVDSIMGK